MSRQPCRAATPGLSIRPAEFRLSTPSRTFRPGTEWQVLADTGLAVSGDFYAGADCSRPPG